MNFRYRTLKNENALGICVICDRIQMLFNLVLRQYLEFSTALHGTDLNFGTSEITAQNVAKACNGGTDHLVTIKILHFLGPFFEKIHRLLFLRAARRGEEGKVVTCAVNFEDLGTLLVVDPDEKTNTSEGTGCRRLCVHLCQVCHSASKDRHGHRIPIIKRPLPSLMTGPHDHRLGIGHGTRNAASYLLSQVEEMGDTGRFH
mmetsp:Transcript_18467/g.44567  ORF Transcript_18467/g.44567 Transcript_18467/m.44567 type:complete len:202 (-) Transcript_18467:312-917(-)